MPRPTKRNDEVEKKICQLLAAGNTRTTSAIVAGISDDTLVRWVRRFAGFAEVVKRAEEEAVARNVALINQAASKSWQAAAWWLERRRPDDWKDRGAEMDSGDAIVFIKGANVQTLSSKTS